MPPLYNTYGAKTLHSKFCKDKQTKLLILIFSKLGSSEILFLPQSPFNQELMIITWLSWEPDLGAPLNYSSFIFFPEISYGDFLLTKTKILLCGWANLKSHPVIPFIQNQKSVWLG